MKDENELIEKKESIFKRIISRFKNIFTKKNDSIEEIEKQEKEESQELLTTYDKEEMLEKLSHMEFSKGPGYSNSEKIDVEAEKNRVRKLYDDVRNGLVDIESLSPTDLIMVNKLLETEVEITKKKLT